MCGGGDGCFGESIVLVDGFRLGAPRPRPVVVPPPRPNGPLFLCVFGGRPGFRLGTDGVWTGVDVFRFREVSDDILLKS
jgi:hypothetical protein